MQHLCFILCWNPQVTPQQKSSIFLPFTPLNRRTPASTCDSEAKDPKNLKRRRGLDYLSRIPSPPPLIPLKTRASPCINKTFNPPRRSVTPKPPQNECSSASRPPPEEEKWVHDEELAMIDTQALVDGLKDDWEEKCESPAETLNVSWDGIINTENNMLLFVLAKKANGTACVFALWFTVVLWW